MIEQHDIEKRSEEALNSLDGIQRAVPAPYFFTRLQVRLREKITIWENITRFINRPAIAFATILFVLALNAFAFLKQQSQPAAAVPSFSMDLNEQSMNDVYDFASKTNNTLLKIWNQENEQPVKK